MKSTFDSARRLLDERFKKVPALHLFEVPQKGWIRAIREALGMTLQQLGKRLGVSKVRVSRIEHDELHHTLTLATLEQTAQALGCRFVYFLIPEQRLQDYVKGQAERKAKRLLKRTRHSMALEEQFTSSHEAKAQLQELIARLLQEKPSKLWEEEE